MKMLNIVFPSWNRNLLISVGLEPVLCHTENHVYHHIIIQTTFHENKNSKIFLSNFATNLRYSPFRGNEP